MKASWVKVSEQIGIAHGFLDEAFRQKSSTSFPVETFTAEGNGVLYASGFIF